MSKSYSFLATDKNAGKTTSFNYVARQKRESGEKLILTSIGQNGETVDRLFNTTKPEITLFKGDLFISASSQLTHLIGRYKILKTFKPPHFEKPYILAEALRDFSLILEGPNSKEEILKLKDEISEFLKSHTFLIDSSIDRQFLGDQKISDEIFLSIITRKEKESSNNRFLQILSCQTWSASSVTFKEAERLQLFHDEKMLYQSNQSAFLDQELRKKLEESSHQELILFLSSSLTPSFYTYLKKFKKLKLVLENFTLLLPLLTHPFSLERIYLQNRPTVAAVFLKEDEPSTLKFPKEWRVCNTFKEEYR